jgi:hypothetical protein
MNFTWFASAYDVDDVPYRLLTSYLHGRFSRDSVARVLPAATGAVALVAVGWVLGETSAPRAVLLQSLVVAALVAVGVRRDRVGA